MRLAMIVTIGVLVGSAHSPCRYEVTAIIQAPACPPFGQRTAFGEFLDLRVDGDNGSLTGDGSGWGLDAYKYLQDALAAAAAAPPRTTVRLWVAATDPSNPYRPDRDADNPFGTEDRNATFLLDFNNVQVLGGFNGTETDADDRDPAVNITVLSGRLNLFGACGDPDAGDCLANNGTPGCEDGNCCALVCAARSQCCTDQWDQACANLANIVCGVCGDPDSGSCFEPNDTPGCEDGNCCALVCNVDPICCILPWDRLCADIAIGICQGGPAKAYHVVTANGVDDSVRIDGFTITDGLADGAGSNGRGAGMWILNASPAVVRVTFIGNSAPFDGGGAMFVEGTAHPLVVNCLMTANDGRFGGAMRIHRAPASATVVNCLISGNTATVSGGGMLISNASPTVVRVTFTKNSAPGHGGGAMHIEGTAHPLVVNTSFIQNTGREAGAIHTESGSPGGTFVNCLFSGNVSQIEGGAINPGGSGTLTFINCTLADNSVESESGAGAILIEGGPQVNLSNCILWGNLAGGIPRQIGGNVGLVTVNYSDVQGGWGDPMDMNIDTDPLFVDPDDGDYHLSPGSPCIDAAKNTAMPKGMDTDFDGNLRFVEDPNTPDTGLGDCPIVDMGSYEFQEGTTDCCPWDLDDNGTVGASDLLSLLSSWGPCKGCPADLDGNGTVGASDLLALLANWGPCP